MVFYGRNEKGKFSSKRTIICRGKRKFFPQYQPSNGENDTASDVKESDSTAGDEEDCQEIKWRDGRRIVELGHLAEELFCHGHLNLSDTEYESRRGFGSTLFIPCSCGFLNSVTTNKTHKVHKRGAPIFDINTKAAVDLLNFRGTWVWKWHIRERGILHSGSGYTQMHNLMSTMEVPSISFKSLKFREQEVGGHISKVAHQSCQDALQLEIDLGKKSSPLKTGACTNSNATKTPTKPDDENGSPHVPTCTVKYDMGLKKRGSGRCYDSLSGVGTMIGNESGKIVAFDVRSMDCRKCTYFAYKSLTPPEHECSKNWSGSSKAMEPDVGACLFREIEQQDVKVGTIIMDDDCTTMAKIRSIAKTPVVKWSDINHTKKHLGSSVYKLQSKHKSLTVKVIQWLQKCFSYAVAQNKNNSSGLAVELNQIVPHAFGSHENCNKNWCMYHRDPAGYKHKSTPYGRNLTGESLRTDLNAIFQTFIQNVEKIAPGGSTREVESFNNMVAAKASKRCHYSATSSLKHRVECAVAQKNCGFGYVNKVNKSVGVSPGVIYKNFSKKLDSMKRKRLDFEKSISFKKRRLQRKSDRKTSSQQKELREGVTYKTAVAMTSISDITEIPAAVVSPVSRCIENISDCKIFCDIETTSLHKLCDLTQIAAISNGESFNKYIMPVKSISPAASQVTGLTVHGNVMYYHGSPVDALSLQESLTLFLSWLEERKPCILVGHNFVRFDFPRLLRALNSCKLLNAFQEVVVGIIDTLPLLKTVYPDLDSYSQQNIVSVVLNENYAAHNALADVESLEKVINAGNVSDTHFEQASATTKSSVQIYFHNIKTDENLSSLDILIAEKIVSRQMAKKIASSGLNFSHLKLAVSRGGLDGLSQLCREKLGNGGTRVTSVRSIIERVYNYFNENKHD